MIEKVNGLFSLVYDAVIFPVSNFSDEIQILYISLLSGIVFLWIYGKVSNQKGLKETKRKVTAYVLEVALYRHSILVCLRSQWNLLKQGVRYVSFALIPLLILMVPCLLIMAELHSHYQSRGIGGGENAIIEISFDNDVDVMDYSLKSDVVKITSPLRIEDEGKIFWKLKNDNISGEKETFVKLNVDDRVLNIPILLDKNKNPNLLVYSKNIFEALMFPTKFSVGKDFSQIKLIKISYPDKIQKYFGVSLNWIWAFLIISILSGLVASKILKVEI